MIHVNRPKLPKSTIIILNNKYRTVFFQDSKAPHIMIVSSVSAQYGGCGKTQQNQKCGLIKTGKKKPKNLNRVICQEVSNNLQHENENSM